jgi:lipoprotein signal peptidase
MLSYLEEQDRSLNYRAVVLFARATLAVLTLGAAFAKRAAATILALSTVELAFVFGGALAVTVLRVALELIRDFFETAMEDPHIPIEI